MLLTPSSTRRRRRASRWRARPKSQPTRSRATWGDRRERQRVHSAATERLDVRAASTERARDERRSLSHRGGHAPWASCGSGTREGRRQSGSRARVRTRAKVAQRALSGEEGGRMARERECRCEHGTNEKYAQQPNFYCLHVMLRRDAFKRSL